MRAAKAAKERELVVARDAVAAAQRQAELDAKLLAEQVAELLTSPYSLLHDAHCFLSSIIQP